jgi:hypothetical protein
MIWRCLAKLSTLAGNWVSINLSTPRDFPATLSLGHRLPEHILNLTIGTSQLVGSPSLELGPKLRVDSQ